MATAAKKPVQQKPGIVKHQQTAPAVTDQRPDFIRAGGSRGSENVQTEDLIIPRLEIAQALSPCVNKGKPEYIDDITPGDLYNNVTREVYEKPVMFVPIGYKKDWILWRKRTEGGGFRGAFATKEEAVRAYEALGKEQDKHEILDTPQQFGILVHADGHTERIVISMGKTKAKHSRRLNTLVMMTNEDRFARVYAIGTAMEKSPKGEYYNFTIEQLGYPSEAVYREAEAFYDAYRKGIVKADTSGIDQTGLHDENGEY